VIRTVDDLFAAWPAAARGIRQRSPETIQHTLTMADPFRRRFGRRVLADLSPVDVARWAGDHVSHARYARTICGDAVLMGVIASSPFAGVSVRPPASSREFIPTREQVYALAEVGAGYGLGTWVPVQANCGARAGAMMHLRAGDVEPGESAWRVNLKRKGRSGTYPAVLLAEGADALALALPERPRDLVFRRPKGGAWDNRSLSRVWIKMRDELGLPEDCTPHCLRRYYASTLVDLGVPWDDVAICLDHVDAKGRPNTEMTRRLYALPDRDTTLARVAGIVAA
jgi:integrase